MIKIIIREAFQQALQFGGRTNRKDYWITYLGTAVIAFILGALMVVPVIDFAAFVLIWWMLIGMLSMTVRRTRDAGLPCWLVIIMCIPFIGFIVFLIATLRGSHYDESNYSYDNEYDDRENNYSKQNVKRELCCPKCNSTNLMIGQGYLKCEECGKVFHVTK